MIINLHPVRVTARDIIQNQRASESRKWQFGGRRRGEGAVTRDGSSSRRLYRGNKRPVNYDSFMIRFNRSPEPPRNIAHNVRRELTDYQRRNNGAFFLPARAVFRRQWDRCNASSLETPKRLQQTDFKRLICRLAFVCFALKARKK